jgi:hypothetical protein
MTREDLRDISTCWERSYTVCDVTVLKQNSESFYSWKDNSLCIQVHLFRTVNVVGKFMKINNSKVICQWDVLCLPACTRNMTTSQSSFFRKRPTQNMFNCVQLEAIFSIFRWCNRKKILSFIHINTGRSHFMRFLFVWFHFDMTWKFTPLFECMW